MRKNSEGTITSWLVWSIAFLTLFILGLFGYATLKERNKKQQIENEISVLKEQAERIRKENMNLEDRLAYLGSEDYRKMQAKEKLNLQSPGESVVVIAPGPAKKEEVSEPTQSNSFRAQDASANYKKWVAYFFD
jgi:cell division protein FtsB